MSDPIKCRQLLKALDMPYPKSSCDECGPIIKPDWKCPHEHTGLKIDIVDASSSPAQNLSPMTALGIEAQTGNPGATRAQDKLLALPVRFETSMGVPVFEFDYINYRGKNSHRRVIPSRIYYGFDQYHHTRDFLLEAMDIEKGQMRRFAMVYISNFRVTSA